MTTNTAKDKAKLTAEERLQSAQAKAQKAAARALDHERKIAERSKKKQERALFLLGEWLEARMRSDVALRRTVKQNLTPAAPYDDECLTAFWADLDEGGASLEATDVETSASGPRLLTPQRARSAAGSVPRTETPNSNEPPTSASAAR